MVSYILETACTVSISLRPQLSFTNSAVTKRKPWVLAERDNDGLASKPPRTVLLLLCPLYSKADAVPLRFLTTLFFNQIYRGRRTGHSGNPKRKGETSLLSK